MARRRSVSDLRGAGRQRPAGLRRPPLVRKRRQRCRLYWDRLDGAGNGGYGSPLSDDPVPRALLERSLLPRNS